MKKHPQLAKKLSLLYALRANPALRSNADLAKKLGISRQSISHWSVGNETRLGDSIPFNQLEIVADLFGVVTHWFTLSYGDFETRLRAHLEESGQQLAKRPIKISLSLLPITSAEIVGRQQERKALDQAWEEEDTNIIQLIAFGGVGKSSVINSWLSELDKENFRGANRVYGWSFYWQGSSSELNSSGDLFIEHALDWFGDANPLEGTPWAKATRLANLIRSSRTLLVLDGLEPLQHPPGPRAGQVENPAVALLIRELATANNGLCVLTSRLSVTDLTSYQGFRVKTLQLKPLSNDFSVEMLKSLGLKGRKSEFNQAIEQYSGHPLSLSLLAGYISVVHDGNIGKFRELKSLLDEQNLGTHTRGLMQIYLDWFKTGPERALLYLVGLFDRAVSLRELQSLVRNRAVDNLTTELASLAPDSWSYAVTRLSDANIISSKRKGNELVLDCHPLVRDFLADYLAGKEKRIWSDGNKLIFEHLLRRSEEIPKTMAEMESLFRAVIHGTRAGLYEEAFQVYFERIKQRQISISTEGSHHSDQTCIRAFFETEWMEPCKSLSEDAQFYLMSSAATNLIYLGHIDQAIEPSLLSIKWFVEQEKWIEAAGTAGPLASMLIAAGRVNEALSLISDLETCFKETKHPVVQAMAKNFQAYACHLCGENDEAEMLFEQVEEVLNQVESNAPVSVPTISSYYCMYLLDRGYLHKALERSLKTFAWRNRVTWQVAADTSSLLATDIFVLGLIFLKLGDLVNAKVYLDRQVELLKSADEWLYLPAGLNSRALFHIKIDNFEAAKLDLEEALSISLRTGAKLGEWESYLNFAQLYFKMGNYSASQDYLLQAQLIPEMKVYKFRDNEISRLEKHLSAARLNEITTNS